MGIFIPDRETARSVIKSLFGVYAPKINADGVLAEYEDADQGYKVLAGVLHETIPIMNEVTGLLGQDVIRTAEHLLATSEAFAPDTDSGKELMGNAKRIKRTLRDGSLDQEQFNAACARLEISLT